MSAESACAVPGARFVAERACGCGSMYLDMAGDGPAFDTSHLGFSFTYEADEREIEAHVLIRSETCVEAGYLVGLGAKSCVASCGDERAYAEDGRCLCDGASALSLDRSRCVVPGTDSDCIRRAVSDGVQVCLAEDICTGSLRLISGGDDHTCVSACPSGKFEEDAETKEFRCVEDCAHWWYRAEDGLCKEQKWRKNTAIAVPIVVVVAIIAVVVAFVVGKKCKGGKKDNKERKMKSREDMVVADA